MKNQIYPCLWFDGQAQEAAKFYKSLFKNSKSLESNSMVSTFEIEGLKVMALNGGPMYKINPSVSFFVTCEDDKEIKRLWTKLSAGGKVYMELNKYPWSDKYGWCGDKYGMTWQIMKGKVKEVNQKIVPLFLFSHKQYGKAKSAINFYTKVFEKSKIETMDLYGKGEAQAKGKVMHSRFKLRDKKFMAMDGPGDHNFDFNEGVSFVVPCDTQKEIDYFWNKFTKGGGQESMCGWCKDKYGVSWQIIPSILGKLMSDPARSQRVMNAFLKMKKFDIEKLKKA